MRVAPAILLLSCACLISGCGTSNSEQVRAKVEQFVKAAAAKDYATICEQVLAPSLITRLSSAGVSCTQGMQIALGGVQNPTISIGRVKISGNRASAITLSSARGQQASLDVIDLVKTGHGWRLSSLASPLTPSNVP
jgi:hypothetical protein